MTLNQPMLERVLSAADAPRSRAIKSSVWTDALIGALAGLAAYCGLGLYHTLPPHNVGWLLALSKDNWWYDPSTAFAAWHYFRHAAWSWPPGLNRAYGMEYGGSIVFADGLPALAFLFKPFDRWLGPYFQYMGIWFLICFVLQGLFAALLASRFVKATAPKFLIALFFALSPALIERTWTEYALMAHWLVLWALYLCLTDRGSRIRWVWMIVVGLAVMLTFYIVPMILLLWSADATRTLIRRFRSIGWLVLEGFGMVGTTLVTMWVVGYFVLSVKNASTPNFGMFAVNLLGPFDPWDWSTFLRNQAKSPYWKGEGYCYFGLGMLFLSAMALREWIRSPVSARAFVRWIPLIFILLLLAAFSLSNKIAFASHVLELPNFWGMAGEIFRASGRMFWPAYYAIWLGVFYLVLRNLRTAKATVLLALMVFVQIVDMLPSHIPMREFYSAKQVYQSPLKDPFWKTAARKYNRIAIIPSGASVPFIPLAIWGADHGIPTNGAYLGRYPGPDEIVPIGETRQMTLLENRPNRRTLYILPEQGRFDMSRAALGPEHGMGHFDGYNIIAPYWFSDGKPAGPGDLQPCPGKKPS